MLSYLIACCVATSNIRLTLTEHQVEPTAPHLHRSAVYHARMPHVPGQVSNVQVVSSVLANDPAGHQAGKRVRHAHHAARADMPQGPPGLETDRWGSAAGGGRGGGVGD